MLLLAVVIALLLSNLGLFLRMNQMQNQVLRLMRPPDTSGAGGLEVKAPAPEFALEAETGQTVTLRDLGDGLVLLMFSQTTCPHCQSMYPTIKQFRELHPDIATIIISLGSKDENKQLAQQLAVPVLNCTDEVMSSYRVRGTPFFYVIDAGIVTTRGSASSLADLEALIEASKQGDG